MGATNGINVGCWVIFNGVGDYYNSFEHDIVILPYSEKAIILTIKTDDDKRPELWTLAINKATGTDADAEFRLLVRIRGGVFRARLKYGLQLKGTSNVPAEARIPQPVLPNSDIKIQCTPSVNGMSVSADLAIWLIDPKYIPPGHADLVRKL